MQKTESTSICDLVKYPTPESLDNFKKALSNGHVDESDRLFNTAVKYQSSYTREVIQRLFDKHFYPVSDLATLVCKNLTEYSYDILVDLINHDLKLTQAGLFHVVENGNKLESDKLRSLISLFINNGVKPKRSHQLLARGSLTDEVAKRMLNCDISAVTSSSSNYRMLEELLKGRQRNTVSKIEKLIKEGVQVFPSHYTVALEEIGKETPSIIRCLLDHDVYVPYQVVPLLCKSSHTVEVGEIKKLLAPFYPDLDVKGKGKEGVKDDEDYSGVNRSLYLDDGMIEDCFFRDEVDSETISTDCREEIGSLLYEGDDSEDEW